MQYRIVQGSYGRLEDGVLRVYGTRSGMDVVDLDPETATRLGAQVVPVDSGEPSSGDSPARPVAVPVKKKTAPAGEGAA